MFAEFPIGGVLLPATLVLAFLAAVATVLTARLLSVAGAYRYVAHRMLVDVSLFSIWLGALVALANRTGYFS